MIAAFLCFQKQKKNARVVFGKILLACEEIKSRRGWIVILPQCQTGQHIQNKN